MVQIGKFNKLKVLELGDFGAYLDAADEGQILLPAKDVPDACNVGDVLDVFVFWDSNDEIIATTQKPKAVVNEFALLKVVDVNEMGAFLDWGMSKDLFLPFSEQTWEVEKDEEVIVYVYLDKSERLCGSMRLNRNKIKTRGNYKVGDKVNIMIAAETDMGFKVILEDKHWGVIFNGDVFQKLAYGQRLPAFIKKIREDGKIDINFQNKIGHKAAVGIDERILELLKNKGGSMALNDKTSAQTIYDLFGVSKKKYKIALGGLYKKRLIVVNKDGIKLPK